MLLLFSNGLHPRATLRAGGCIHPGPRATQWSSTLVQAITSHDSEDYDHLVDLGYTAQGDHVIMNKYVYDADVAVLIGHTQGNPYGGYPAASTAPPASPLAEHLCPPRAPGDATAGLQPVSTNSEMRHKFDQQGM